MCSGAAHNCNSWHHNCPLLAPVNTSKQNGNPVKSEPGEPPAHAVPVCCFLICAEDAVMGNGLACEQDTDQTDVYCAQGG